MRHVKGKPVKASTYTNHRCRCTGCRKAWADYYGRYRRTGTSRQPLDNDQDTPTVGS